MKRETYKDAQKRAIEMYAKANIILTDAEQAGIEVADFGLDDLERTGLELVVYVNTDKCCAKEMVLFPRQTCPEHSHEPLPSIGYTGKEETFRCRYGTVYLVVEGEKTENMQSAPPKGDEEYYTVFHEITLNEGEQYTMLPGTKHWFQSGDKGAVISEFSTKSMDELDIFTDCRIKRISEII